MDFGLCVHVVEVVLFVGVCSELLCHFYYPSYSRHHSLTLSDRRRSDRELVPWLGGGCAGRRVHPGSDILSSRRDSSVRVVISRSAPLFLVSRSSLLGDFSSVCKENFGPLYVFFCVLFRGGSLIFAPQFDCRVCAVRPAIFDLSH